MKEMCYNTNQGIPRCKEVQKFIWPANCTLHPNFLHKNGKDFFFFFFLYGKQPNLSISVMFLFLVGLNSCQNCLKLFKYIVVTTQGKALATSALATSALYLKWTNHN